jgi:hypothetical protein
MAWWDRNMSWLWLTFKILKVHDIVGGDGDNLFLLFLLFQDFFSWEDSQHISFYRLSLSASRPTPSLESQVSVFISPGDRVAQLYSPATV